MRAATQSWSVRRSAIGTLFLIAAVSGVESAAAQETVALSPTYSFLFNDAVTGTNCAGMTLTGGCTGSGWSVTAGADVYANDVYERPTSQTYTGPTPVASEYLGYLDLVTAQYGFDDQFMYFKLTMYSPFLYKNDGTVDTGVFGSGTYYGVQLGSINSNDGQLLLRTEQTKSTIGTSTGLYSSATTQGWFDQNNDVSGPGGINTTNEKAGNGYELDVIKTDGYLDINPKNYVLFSRSYVDALGQAVVELAFDWVAFSAYCVAQSLECVQNPTSLPYLVFETTRGLKDNQNYLWNDEYTASEAGTPYTTAGLGNIYELDNMRVFADTPGTPQEVVPEPATMTLLATGLAMMGLRRRRKS